MRDRRYGVDSRGRSPSPRRRPWPISRDFSPSRHRKLAPYHRHEKEEYSQEARTSRRIEERGYMDRDYNFRGSRLSELDNRHRNRDRDRDMDMDRDRGRDENVVGSRGYRSPRGIEKRDDFDRPLKSSNYGDLFKGKYENGTSFDHSKRSYAEDSYNGDGSSTKFQYDRLLGGPVNSDYLSSKNGTFARDSRGIGDPDITRGGERDYYSQDRYLDSGRAQVLSVPQYLDGAKPAPTEYESGRMYSRSYSLADGGVRDIPVRNCSGGDGGSHMLSVASRYLNIDADKQKYYETCDEPHLARRDVEDNYVGKKNYGYHFQDKFLGTGKSEREIHKLSEEDNILSSRGYLKGDSDYMLPSSRSKAYDTKPLDVLKEGMPGCSAHRMSDVIQRGTELSSLSTGFDPYNAKKQNVFSEGPRNQLDTQSSSELYTRLPEERQGDWSYVESGRRIKDNMSWLNEVEEDYRDLHTSGTDLLNRTIDERFPKSHMGDDVPHEYDQYPSYKVQLTHDIFDGCDPLQVRNQDVDTLRTRSSHPNYVNEGYFRRGIKPEEHHADVDSGQWSRFERSDLISSRGYGPSYDKLIDSPREEMMPMTELSLDEHSERRLSEKHVSDTMLYEHDAGIKISTDGNGSRMIYNQVDAEDADYLYLSKKPKFGRHHYEKTWWLSSEMGNDQPSSSNALPRSSIIPHKSDSRDIKKRLGPIHQKLHVSHRIVDKYKPSVKKRLAAARPKKYAAPPWLKKKNSYIVASNQNGLDGDAQDHDGDHLGDHLHLGKSEPPEKSEEFKQLVQSAFFKFLKQINETPIKRKKYLEQGQASTIKCIVCGRILELFKSFVQ